MNVHNSEACSWKYTSESKPVVSVKDVILNIKDFMLSIAVENSLPLSKVPKLVEFAKFLSKDINVLQYIKMDRTAAICKLRHGLSFHNHRELIDKMNKYPLV